MSEREDLERLDRAVWRRDYLESCGEIPETQGPIPPALVAWRAERRKIDQDYQEWLRTRRVRDE